MMAEIPRAAAATCTNAPLQTPHTEATPTRLPPDSVRDRTNSKSGPGDTFSASAAEKNTNQNVGSGIYLLCSI